MKTLIVSAILSIDGAPPTTVGAMRRQALFVIVLSPEPIVKV